jgi:hypothetical protein
MADEDEEFDEELSDLVDRIRFELDEARSDLREVAKGKPAERRAVFQVAIDALYAAEHAVDACDE